MADTYDLKKITPDMEKVLMEEGGIYPGQITSLPSGRQKKIPYTAAGLSSMNIGEMPMNDSLGGFTLPQYNKNDELTGKSAIVMNSRGSDYRQTLGHEIEHALEMQSGEKHKIHNEWDRLTEKDKNGDRLNIVKKLIDHAPYLQSKWGLNPENSYFTREMMDYQGGRAKNLLHEQLASLSSIEQIKNKRLTDDPYVRKNIFTTPEQRAAYNAITGLRQTRLDPRDLPSYTAQEDKSDPGYSPNPKSTMQKLKSALGFAKGGMVDKSIKGGNKLI
jgi:hypothetical protein